MSSVHVAAAANEVAAALPSTATVSVSKHGIQAVETLNLKCQTVSQSQIRWSRSFDGREVITNPYVKFRVTAEMSNSNLSVETAIPWMVRDAVRPTCDPFLNMCDSLRVTVNNASMSVQNEHRIVTSTFAPDVKDQRDHYGLNQLDDYAEARARTYYLNSYTRGEKQFNVNALRENYPVKFEARFNDTFYELNEEDYILGIFITFDTAPTSGDRYIIAGGISAGTVGLFYPDATTNYQRHGIVSQISVPTDGNWTSVNAQKEVLDELRVFTYEGVPVNASWNFVYLHKDTTSFTSTTTTNVSYSRADRYRWTYDIYQPLNHPYFRDTVMRDNTLVNCKFLEVEANINPSRLVEVSRIDTARNDAVIGSFEIKLDTVEKPTLIMDLITPSVPMPTLSEKPVSSYHLVTSTPRKLTAQKPLDDMASGHIMLAQVPDKIYVFVRSNKDLSQVNDGTKVPTRLGVITGMRIQTPQDAAMMVEMGQESLYQMSKRNGSKQSRPQFMCTAGSVVCIDPERDLGGFTNGVLAPFAFDLRLDFSLPMRSGDETKSILTGKMIKDHGMLEFYNYSDETWTMFVVCELEGHLYLMKDGSAKQTKSNLTMSQVSDAVSQGLHHPTTFPGDRVQKMDSGLLSEIGALKIGDAADDVRAQLRA